MTIYKEQETKNVVYFAEFKNGLLKIGTTTHLKNRIRALRHQCGFGEIRYFCVEGSYGTESYFKKAFKGKNTFGEWFKISYDKMFDFVKNHSLPIKIEKEEEIKDDSVTIPLYDIKDFSKYHDLHNRYFVDILNSLFIRKEYKHFEKLLGEMLDFNKELGDEEYKEALEDSEIIDDSYDLYCYIARRCEFSWYPLDYLFKKFFKYEISYLKLIELGILELKKIRGDGAIYIKYVNEEKIATRIEVLKELDLTDKETYQKIKEIL